MANLYRLGRPLLHTPIRVTFSKIRLSCWKKSIIFLKFPHRLPFLHLCEIFRPMITSLFVYGLVLSINYSSPSVVLLSLPHWLSNISRISYIMPTPSTQDLLKTPILALTNLDG